MPATSWTGGGCRRSCTSKNRRPLLHQWRSEESEEIWERGRRWEETGEGLVDAAALAGACLAAGSHARGALPGGANRKEEAHERRSGCNQMGFGGPRSCCSGPWHCWWVGGADLDPNLNYYTREVGDGHQPATARQTRPWLGHVCLSELNVMPLLLEEGNSCEMYLTMTPRSRPPP